MREIENFVNTHAHHHRGRAPKPNKALQAVVAVYLLDTKAFGINTITAAALVTGVSRAMVEAAQVLIQSADSDLIADVLERREPLLKTAEKVRTRAKLIQSFKAASPEDRIAFGHAVGAATVFDAAVAPLL